MLKWLVLLCATPCWAVEVETKYSVMAADLVAEAPDGVVVAVDRIEYAFVEASVDGAMFTERLTTALTKFPNITVVERNKLERIMAELKLQRSGAVDEDTTKQIGKLTGASHVIVGSIVEADEAGWLLASLSLIYVEDGSIRRSTAGKVRRRWRVPKPVQVVPERAPDHGPISLGQLTKPKKAGTGKAIWIGEGCGVNLYYESDGSFMRWARQQDHGTPGFGAYITAADRGTYCDHISYIDQVVRYRHPELQDAWRAYRRENRI